jgi:hypothetical protein
MPEVAKIKGLDIRDKKIADSTAVTSVTQTDSIRMTTTSGEEVFIARDSFVDAIASVFKSNAKSSITSLFGELTESNVSSVGSINMSNLASVLSALMGFMPFVAYNQNLDNNYTTPYIMAYYGTTSAVKINVPFSWSGTRRCVQIRITGASISYRAYDGSSWSSYVSAAFS